MRILYFHQHFSTPSGSTGTRSYEMARALIKTGHEVTMVCGSYSGGVSGLTNSFSRGKRSGLVDGIKVIELRLAYSNYDSFIKRSWTFFKFAARSMEIVLQEPFDLVFSTTTPLTAGLPGIAARWLCSKRFVFEVRDLWPELPKAMGVISNPVVLWLMSLLEWISYRSAHACIGLSPGIVEGIKNRSYKGQQLAMIPNGCDLDLFSGDRPRKPGPVRDSDVMAVFTGAHGIANGLDAVLNAAAILKKRGRNDIKMVFIGDGRLKPALRQQAEEKQLTNCLFLDPLPKSDLVRYMQGANIGLMILANVPAFYYGTSPNKFFDYLSVGLPVLNNYPGWLADMIQEHDCGFVVKPDNALDFADALEYAADHPEKLKEKGLNAQRLAREQFDRKILASEFVACLERASQRGRITK